MVELILQLIIVVLIVGFIYWVYLKLIPLVPLPAPFRQILDVLVVILIGAIVLFYVIIPLIRVMGRELRLSELALTLFV